MKKKHVAMAVLLNHGVHVIFLITSVFWCMRVLCVMCCSSDLCIKIILQSGKDFFKTVGCDTSNLRPQRGSTFFDTS